MPTIHRFPFATIKMYPGDHLPAHFHIRMNDGREVLVTIADLRVLRGKLSRRELAPILEWTANNTTALHARWRELNP